jgi:Ca2+-binding EF-hand superfamily protein
MRSTRMFLCFLTLLAAAPAAQAQMKGDFDQADADHDGHVTFQEYQAYVSGHLADLDGPIAQRFKQLSPEEQASRLHRRFDTADKGHKGYLDRKDWSGS